MNVARITLHNATDLLEIVPVLLGFVPAESLVAIFLQATGGRPRVAMTARVELPLSPNE